MTPDDNGPRGLLLPALAILLLSAPRPVLVSSFAPSTPGKCEPWQQLSSSLADRRSLSTSFSDKSSSPDAFSLTRRRAPLVSAPSRTNVLCRAVPTSVTAAGSWIQRTLTRVDGSIPPSASVAAAVLTISLYHINLIRSERNDTVKTWRVFQADTRENWARYVRKTEGWLYAVQTLRNAITAQTFLATTVLSLLTLITGRVWDILRPTTVVPEKRLLTIQLVSIAFTMLLSAYNFLQGVRFMTHAGFMFPVSKGTKVDKIMRQSQNCQWLGLRWMYISIGPIAWAVGGGRAFLVASLILTQFFRLIDQKPGGMKYEEFQGAGI